MKFGIIIIIFINISQIYSICDTFSELINNRDQQLCNEGDTKVRNIKSKNNFFDKNFNSTFSHIFEKESLRIFHHYHLIISKQTGN